jgi:hypothetical protein
LAGEGKEENFASPAEITLSDGLGSLHIVVMGCAANTPRQPDKPYYSPCDEDAAQRHYGYRRVEHRNASTEERPATQALRPIIPEQRGVWSNQ